MSRIVRTAASAALLLALGGQATAYDPIVLKRGWYRVDSFEDGDCAGEVGTNGRFYVLSVTGVAPGEEMRLFLTNGDMPSIDRIVHADRDGAWQTYYIPFRPKERDGGVVQATVTSASCEVPLRFEWRRYIGWDGDAAL